MLSLTIGQAVDGMDWLQWSASVIASTAWPIAAVVIACVFRSHIIGVIGRLRELSWGDKSAKFTHQLDKLESQVTPADGGEVAIDPTAGQAAKLDEVIATPDHDAAFMALLTLSPNAAVLTSWDNVVQGLRAYARRKEMGEEERGRRVSEVVRALQNRGYLPQTTFTMISTMSEMRDQAAHGAEISVSDAMRFNELAKQVLERFLIDVG